MKHHRGGVDLTKTRKSTNLVSKRAASSLGCGTFGNALQKRVPKKKETASWRGFLIEASLKIGKKTRGRLRLLQTLSWVNFSLGMTEGTLLSVRFPGGISPI